MQVQQHIYLRDFRRHSVAASQRRNDHMQVYIIIMEGKYNFLNGLMVDRLARPRSSPCNVPEVSANIQTFL